MTDPADLSIVLASRKEGDHREVGEILSALKEEQPTSGWLQAFDLRAIASHRHVESAFLHAMRAGEHGRSRVQDPGAVMALYLAGTDQLERAMARVGIAADTRDLLLVASPARDLGPALDRAGLVAKDGGPPEIPPREALQRLEIDSRLYSSRPPGEWEYAVLEHSAMVDFKQHRPAPGPKHGPAPSSR